MATPIPIKQHRLAENANHGDDQCEDESEVQVCPVIIPVEGLFLCLMHTLSFYHNGPTRGPQDSREFILDRDPASLAEIIARSEWSAAVRAEFVFIGGF